MALLRTPPACLQVLVIVLLVLVPLYLQDLMPLFIAEFLQIFRRKKQAPHAEDAQKLQEEQMQLISRTPRGPIVGGNWKCNPEKSTSIELLCKAVNKCDTRQCELYVCPSTMHLAYMPGMIENETVLCAQNCNFVGTGAYTGEVAPEQLQDMGVHWVLLGHSERRQHFKEDDQLLLEKMEYALSVGMKVVFAFGEKKSHREQGKTMEFCIQQLQKVKHLLDPARVVLAYEPVWAIGTGLVATPEMAQETHRAIRCWIATNVSTRVAAAIRIQYGGSVSASNAADLASQPDIDGFLVGGASLQPQFIEIVATLVAAKASPNATA